MWHHLGDLLVDATTRAPDSSALIAGDGRRAVTYAELSRRADELGAALERNGVRPGDVVAIQARNSVEFVVALVGAAGAGVVVAPLDPSLPDSEKLRRLDLVGARATLVDRDPLPSTIGCPDWRIPDGTDGFAPPPRDTRGPAGLRDDDAVVMLTSGTTGTPKVVPWTHQSLAASVAGVVSSYRLTAADATVAVMPLFHGHGLVAALLATLATGGTVLMPARGNFTAHTFWDDMAAAQATWYTAVPTIHRMLLHRATAGKPDAQRTFPQLRFIRSCSAPASPELIGQLENRFSTVVLTAYGTTETTHQASTVRPDDPDAVRLHTVGTPTGTTVRITGTDGNECRAGDFGEIWLRGPTVTRGYLDHPAADSFTDGWLRTGDLGLVDLDGNLTVTGRIKNLINRGGEKISPEHVEEVLTGHPNVTQAAVVGIPDSLYGEGVAAAVVVNPAGSLDADKLVDYCRTRLAPFEVPEVLMFVTEIPLSAKGDVDRTALADQLAQRAVAD